MPDFLIVALKITSMFLLMLIGWVAHRYAGLTDKLTRVLSRLIVDLVFPALVFTYMLKTVNPVVLRNNGFVPLMGALVLVVAELVALLVIPFFTKQGHKMGTAVFLAAMPNWIYFPLPIVQELFGDAGVRTIFLYNIGAQLMLWTMGIWTVRSSGHGMKMIKNLAVNPGLLATVAGIIIALTCPAARTLEVTKVVSDHSIVLFVSSAIVQALSMLGSLTIPLSLFVTGAQLGSLKLTDHRPTREFMGVILSRLIFAPLVTISLFQVLHHCGIIISDTVRITGYLIACMPIAVSCSIITDRFGGDTALGARAIFYSTLFSIATVPIFYYFITYFSL